MAANGGKVVGNRDFGQGGGAGSGGGTGGLREAGYGKGGESGGQVGGRKSGEGEEADWEPEKLREGGGA